MLLYIMLAYVILFVCIMLFLSFLAIDLCKCFLLNALSWFIDTVCLFQALFCLMHSALNIMVLPNSMFTLLFLNERAMCYLEK